MSELFEKNLKHLERNNPLFALQLRFSKLQKMPLSKEKKPLMIPKEETEVVYSYGSMQCYPKLEKWLHQRDDRRLIVLEDDLSRFGFFLSQVEAERALLDHQVTFVMLADPIEQSLKEVIWPHLFRPYEFFTTMGKGQELSALFSELWMGCEMTTCLYRDYGAPQMQNIVANLKVQREVFLGDALKGTCRAIPAILCGAGPSLEKNMGVLKSLGSRALIFAGGSALGSLSQEGVPIHFGAALDPDSPIGNGLKQADMEVPFFYQNQVSPPLFAKWQGECICLGESGGFPLERWMLKRVGRDLAPFDAGPHVGTFMAQIACMLGCSPIIFVGMDGCFSDDRLYAKGVRQSGEKERHLDLMTVRDRFGNLVQTRRDFLSGLFWIGSLAKKSHPSTLFLNATEGGISMKGIENMCLEKVREKWLENRLDIPEIQERMLRAARPESLSSTQFDCVLSQISSSVKKCFALCENLVARLARDGDFPIYRSSKYALQDLELSEEIFFQMVLCPLWDVWRHFLQREKVVSEMQIPDFEKRLQQVLFYREVCGRYDGVF